MVLYITERPPVLQPNTGCVQEVDIKVVFLLGCRFPTIHTSNSPQYLLVSMVKKIMKNVNIEKMAQKSIRNVSYLSIRVDLMRTLTEN